MLHADVTERIIHCALHVHSALAAGMLESTYHVCLECELSTNGVHFERQVGLPVVYRNVRLHAGYRIDFLVEERVIVEIKAVKRLLPVHTAQLISYLKLSKRQVGLLINFNVPHLREGIKRVVNEYAVRKEKDLPSEKSVLGEPSASTASSAVGERSPSKSNMPRRSQSG
jgi:GxxExxY protein